MTWQQAVNDALLHIFWAERRIDPYVRPFADRLVKPPLLLLAQWLINVTQRDEGLALAKERRLPDEEKVTAAIAEQMSRFLQREYRFGTAERAGNTKTYGIVRAEFTFAMVCPRTYGMECSASLGAIRRGPDSPGPVQRRHRTLRTTGFSAWA